MIDAKKDNVKNNSIGSMAAGIAGVAIGATAVALSDKRNRKKIGKAFGEVVDQGKEALNDLQDRVKMQVKEIGKRAKDAIREERAKTNRRIALH